jgi:hypothetical protein
VTPDRSGRRAWARSHPALAYGLPIGIAVATVLGVVNRSGGAVADTVVAVVSFIVALLVSLWMWSPNGPGTRWTCGRQDKIDH